MEGGRVVGINCPGDLFPIYSLGHKPATLLCNSSCYPFHLSYLTISNLKQASVVDYLHFRKGYAPIYLSYDRAITTNGRVRCYMGNCQLHIFIYSHSTCESISKQLCLFCAIPTSGISKSSDISPGKETSNITTKMTKNPTTNQ